jgi:hypothetical protein
VRDRPPTSLAGLRRRAEEDVARFRDVLRAHAFYAAEVSYAIDEVVGDRHRVVVTLDAGPQYKLKHVEIRAEFYIPEKLPAGVVRMMSSTSTAGNRAVPPRRSARAARPSTSRSTSRFAFRTTRIEVTPNISIDTQVGGDARGNVGVHWKWDY